MSRKTLASHTAAAVLGFAAAASASAQESSLAFHDGNARVGPLVQISAKSPFGELSACGNFPGTVGAPGINFVNSEIEPWVEANPKNPNNIVAYWQQDRWSNGGSRGLVAGVSLDGGATWKTVPVPGLTQCSPRPGKYERASDPWLSFSPDGTLHQISLSFDNDPPPNLPALFGPNALLVSSSMDGGLNWSDPIPIIEATDPRQLNDKQSITADPADSNYVYAAWDRLELQDDLGTDFKGPAFFARTTDGGKTWEPARPIYENGLNNQVLGAQIVVAPNGKLFNFFNEIVNIRPDGTQNRQPSALAFLTSTDKGATWSERTNQANRILSVGTFTPNLGIPVRDAAILFDVAVDSRSGMLYAVWQDARFSLFDFDSIAFSMSGDEGRTWSSPIRVNQTPRNLPPLRQQAFVPSVAVTKDGTIVITNYDFRNDDNDSGELVDHFAVSCRFACQFPGRWTNEARLTNQSFDLLQAPFARGLFLGDYVGLATDGRSGLSVFGVANDASDPTSLYFRRVR